MHLYSLTALTGSKAGAGRTVTVATVDWTPRVLVVTIASALPAVVITAIVWSFVGTYAILTPFVVVGAGLWLFASRTRDSRDLHRYRALLDSRGSSGRLGRFFLAGQEVDPRMNELVTLHRNTVPVVATKPHAVPNTRPTTTEHRDAQPAVDDVLDSLF